MKLLECKVEAVFKKTSASTEATLRGFVFLSRFTAGDAPWLRSAKGWAMTASSSWTWRRACQPKDREVQYEICCSRGRHNGGRTQREQERQHIYPCHPWCIASPTLPGPKTNGPRWLMNGFTHRRRTEQSYPQGTGKGITISSWLSGSGESYDYISSGMEL